MEKTLVKIKPKTLKDDFYRKYWICYGERLNSYYFHRNECKLFFDGEKLITVIEPIVVFNIRSKLFETINKSWNLNEVQYYIDYLLIIYEDLIMIKIK